MAAVRVGRPTLPGEANTTSVRQLICGLGAMWEGDSWQSLAEFLGPMKAVREAIYCWVTVKRAKRMARSPRRISLT